MDTTNGAAGDEPSMSTEQTSKDLDWAAKMGRRRPNMAAASRSAG